MIAAIRAAWGRFVRLETKHDRKLALWLAISVAAIAIRFGIWLVLG